MSTIDVVTVILKYLMWHTLQVTSLFAISMLHTVQMVFVNNYTMITINVKLLEYKRDVIPYSQKISSIFC